MDEMQMRLWMCLTVVLVLPAAAAAEALAGSLRSTTLDDWK